MSERRKVRSAGESHIRLRPDGRWECRMTIDGKIKSVYGKTQAEVKAKRKETLKLAEAGVDVTKRSDSVEAFMTAWLDDVVRVHNAPRTHEGYVGYVNRYILPSVGKIKLRELKLTDVEKMLREMTAKGLAPRSVSQCRAILRAAMNHAIRAGLIDRNPAQFAKPPAKKTTEPHYLTAEQSKRLLDTTREHDADLFPMVALALYTGLRFGELAGLAWSNVDMDARSLRVTRTVVRVGGAWQFGEPKTHRSRRTLSLPQPAIDALIEQRDRQAFLKRQAEERWRPYDLVFATVLGTPVDPSNCTKRLHKLLALAGLDKMGWHALRHSCASTLVALGIPMRSVMEQLGHSQMALTSDLYSHVAPAMLKDNASALEKAFG